MAITVRGTGIAYVNNSAAGSIAFPAGSAAGDACILFVAHGFAASVPTPKGWQTIDNSTGTNVNGSAFIRHLEAEDIAQGSVALAFDGTYYGTLSIIAFVGAVASWRTFVKARSSTGALTRTLTTAASPIVGDYAIYFGAGRFNGTVTSSAGGSLRTSSNANASGVLAGGVLAGAGAVSSTFTFSATPTGDYEIIVIVAETPIAALQLRQPLLISEALSDGVPKLRQPFILSEGLSEGQPNLRQPFIFSDVLSEGFPTLRQSLILVEVLIPVPPEGIVSTELFPGSPGSTASLPGLAFSVHKRPRFSTLVHKAQSGVSVRNAQMQYPLWEFEFTYEFISDDRSAGQSSLQALMGFFLSRQGGFDTFLLKDNQNDGLCGHQRRAWAPPMASPRNSPSSGRWGVRREGRASRHRPDDHDLWLDRMRMARSRRRPAPTRSRPRMRPPSSRIWASRRPASRWTKVASAPDCWPVCSVNIATGVYTFAAADQNQAVVIRYRYHDRPAGYTVTLPNLVIFTSARRRRLDDLGRFRILLQLPLSRGCGRLRALRRQALAAPADRPRDGSPMRRSRFQPGYSLSDLQALLLDEAIRGRELLHDHASGRRYVGFATPKRTSASSAGMMESARSTRARQAVISGLTSSSARRWRRSRRARDLHRLCRWRAVPELAAMARGLAPRPARRRDDQPRLGRRRGLGPAMDGRHPHVRRAAFPSWTALADRSRSSK
jgi:hypothetical protein